MPNHVTNRIIFKKKVPDELLSKYYYPDSKDFPDFNKIVPQPENLFKEDLYNEDIKRCRENNIPNWYDWNIKYWGTK